MAPAHAAVSFANVNNFHLPNPRLAAQGHSSKGLPGVLRHRHGVVVGPQVELETLALIKFPARDWSNGLMQPKHDFVGLSSLRALPWPTAASLAKNLLTHSRSRRIRQRSGPILVTVTHSAKTDKTDRLLPTLVYPKHPWCFEKPSPARLTCRNEQSSAERVRHDAAIPGLPSQHMDLGNREHFAALAGLAIIGKFSEPATANPSRRLWCASSRTPRRRSDESRSSRQTALWLRRS